MLARFYLVLVLAVVTLVTGLSTGFGLAYRLLYVLGLTALLSYGWSWISLQSLQVEVERRSLRVRVGDSVDKRITIRNLSSLPKPLLEVEDLTDLPGYSSGMALSMSPKAFRSWRTHTPARKRGAYTMGPVRVVSSDAFGLFRRERFLGDTDRLVVYPRTFDVPGFSIPAAHLSGESSARKRSHDLTPHAASVRDYAYGDSISRVHWNSTARLGKLMSKEFDLGRSSDVWLVVDLHVDVQAGELEESTDEYGVSIAASLARKYLDSQLPVGLIAQGDEHYSLPAETGAGQFDRVMEYLAISKSEGTVPLESLLANEENLWSYHSSLVVITSSPREEWVTALKTLAQRRVRVAVVLLDGGSFGAYFNSLDVLPGLYAAGIAPYVVRKGDDISVALSQPYAPPTSMPSDRLDETEAPV